MRESVAARGGSISLARASMLAPIMFAGALVLWPSASWLARWPAWTGTWSGPVSLAIGNVTALLAVGLAAVLVLRRDAHVGALPLTASLAAAATGWGIMTGPPMPLQGALVCCAMFGAAAAFVRFTVVYPHPFTAEELHARVTASARRRLRRGAHRDDPLGTLAESPEHLASRWMFALLGARRYRRLARRMRVLSHIADPLLDMDRLTLGLLRIAANPWRATLLTALIIVGLAIADTDAAWVSTALAVVTATFIMMALFTSTLIAREGYLAADTHTKDRSLWIMEGFIAGFVLVMLATLCVPLGAFLHAPQVFGAAPVGVMLGALAFTVCLMVSVFFHGALDAGLMIRRTVFAGLFGALLAFLFAVIEQTVTTMIAERFDLPESTGLIVSGAVAAGIFGPLWQSVNRWVSKRLPA